MFRYVKGHDEPEGALDHVEYDECDAPFYFFDENTGDPLGRGTLCWFLDVYSHSVVGFYVGFEPAGDLTMMSAAKHACLPKTYVKSEYPGIANDYIQHGVFKMIRIDNSKQGWGRSAAALAKALDCDWDWCPSRTPYFKAIVEGLFRILNKSLLENLPGFVLPKELGRSDYDPAVDGCIGFRRFLHIFHKWLIDIYHPGFQTFLGTSPNGKWQTGTEQVSPGLLDASSDTKTLFGIEREGRLDHRGVVYENLRYRDGLQPLRLMSGDVLKVRVKVDPSDLAYVHVWDTRNEVWLPARSDRPDYATGMSLHRHQIHMTQALVRYKRSDVEACARARDDIRQLITQSLGQYDSVRLNSALARYEGVGTDNVFANLGHDGKLGALTGPFAGQTLGPRISAPNNGSSTTENLGREIGPSHGESRAGEQPPGAQVPNEPPRDVPPPLPPRRPRKTLTGDLSLARAPHFRLVSKRIDDGN